MRFIGLSVVLLFVLFQSTFAEEKGVAPRSLAETGPKAKAVKPPDPTAVAESIRRGVAFLVADQNPNGSWGSAEQTKDLNIYAPVPGAHHAFRSAVTSLCVSALVDTGNSKPEVALVVDRGEAWMQEYLPKLRRASGDAIYNVWGHAYGIEAFVKLHSRHAGDEAHQAELNAGSGYWGSVQRRAPPDRDGRADARGRARRERGRDRAHGPCVRSDRRGGFRHRDGR